MTANLESYTRRSALGTDVLVHVQCSSPAAPTALLLGWLGATPRPLSKYALLFQDMGYNTVQTVSPGSAVFNFSQEGIARLALSLTRVLAERDGDEEPRLCVGGVVVASFSNGGATILPKFSRLFQLAADCTPGEGRVARLSELPLDPVSRLNLTADDISAVLAVRNAMAAVLFDSGPCYLSLESGSNAIATSMGVTPESLLGRLTWLAFAAFAVAQLPIHGNFSDIWWTAMCDAVYGCPEMYIYSAMDRMLDEEELDKLVELRWERAENQTDVLWWKVDDAPHVAILLKHREEYVRKIHALNEWGVNRFRKQAKLPPWTIPVDNK